MATLIGDVRHALRQFWSARIFTVTAVLTLAIGIGGTTAIFTLIHAVMLRSLPVSDPARLYRIGDGDNCCVQGGTQDRWGMFSYPLFERLKADLPEFEELTAFQAGQGRVSARRPGVEEAARALRSSYIGGNYFATLGVPAFGGRVITPADDTAAAPPVVVMSHHAWTGTYGADPKIIGATLVLEGHPFTVVGMTGPGFFGETLRGDPPDLWIPLHQEPLIAGETALLRQPVSAWLRVIGRLKPGATTDGMSARLTGILRQWLQHDSGYPANWMPGVIQELPQQSIAVVPAGGGVGIMREQYSRSLRILFGVCALVLLIACANVANLLLARAVARRGQTAVRLALGASRQQIVTQALLESVLLAMLGGIIGLAVAVGTAGCCWRWPSPAPPSCRSTRCPRRWCSPSRSRWPSSPACSSGRRRPGSRRAPTRSTRCAAPAAAAAIIRRSRARRWSCCRPRCRSCWSSGRCCWPAAWPTSRTRTSASRPRAASSCS